MKLLRARIQNFRLLKDIDLEFGADQAKGLTVIRAANDSGKTTLLTALQWGLFGDQALQDGGRDYRLSPLDISSGTLVTVDVSVELDWETRTPTGKRKYRILRHAKETARGKEWERSTTRVSLYRLTSSGANKLDNPEAHIQPHLPRELREVFFTDGDRALSFIEGSRGHQVQRVKEAIRSLLGFSIVERALQHTRDVTMKLNRKVRKDARGRQDLQAVSDELTALHEQITAREESVAEAITVRDNLEDHAKGADRELSAALRKGNKEELEDQRQTAVRSRKSAERDADQASRDQANLFRSELLGKHMLARPFAIAKDVLDGLREQGKIPNQTIPVLEDRLGQPTCICGESLARDDLQGDRRRAHIRHLIDESRKSDAIQEKVTELYFSAQGLLTPVQGHTWSDEYSAVLERRMRANGRREEFGEEEAAIDAKIASLPDADVRQLRIARDRFREQLMDAQRDVGRLETLWDTERRDVKRLETERDKLLQRDDKSMRIGAELAVAQDLQEVLTNALETMRTRELQRVSDRMNDIFLKMIGADAAQRAIIRRATITPEFRILVFGLHDNRLDPSLDLNGASRRALTIAFILALTQVSEVEAPNVIDTPLGMMSGYVKRAVLQLAAEQSSQLILFLTHSEIVNCEDILDQCAGRIYTLTNPAHFPRILINDPQVTEAGVLLCHCTHRQTCRLCERRETATLAE